MSKTDASQIHKNSQLLQEIEILKSQMHNHEETSSKMQSLELSIEILQKSEMEF